MGILIFPGAILAYAMAASLWDFWLVNRRLPRRQWYTVPLVLAAFYGTCLAIVLLWLGLGVR